MNPFVQMALWAGCAASVTGGIVGSYVVVKRIVFISGSIAHAVLGGMGLFLFLRRTLDIPWLSPLYGALVAAVIASFFMGWVHVRHKDREDTVIGALWSCGMALGVIFTALTPGYNVELMNFLFGNILWVSLSDISLLIGLDLCVFVLTAVFHKKFLAICFDEQLAELRGISVRGYYQLLLCLVAISVVVLIQIVGAVLVVAMLTIPAAIASGYVRSLGSMMRLAVILSCICVILGIALSYFLNWPPGATIALVASFLYLVSLQLRRFFSRSACRV